MMNFGSFNSFDSLIKKLKTTLDCINYVIYTCVRRRHKVFFHLGHLPPNSAIFDPLDHVQPHMK